MKHKLFIYFLIIIGFFTTCKIYDLSIKDILSYEKEVLKYQNKLKKEFENPELSPLDSSELVGFNGIQFFQVDTSFRVVAHIEKTPNSKPFEMKTSTDRTPSYRQYGKVHFYMKGENHTLSIYQSVPEIKDYENYLFLPFYDLTNGETSYGGGRYLDLELPNGNKCVLDFNKAYNPYCAYSYRYSCPVPPKENELNFEVKAGVSYHENY